MMSSLLPYLILSCMLCKTVVTQVLVSADPSEPANGATVTLTCNITSFTLPSSWINDTSTSSGVLSICPPAGTCSPTTSGRYSFSATSSTSVAQILAFNASSDNFGWKCRHDIYTDVFKFKFAATTRSISSTNNTTCELELGCGIGFGSGIPFVITIIVFVIYIYKGDTYAYQLGLLLGLGFGITFDVGWIIIVSLISTGNKCKLELGLALGLSSGIPCVIACIVAVIFMFVEFKGIPRRVNIGKGILTGLLIASVIGIIVVYLFYEKLKAEPTAEEPEEKPTEPNNKEPEEMPLGSTDKKNKTKHTGSSAAVSREHVEIQVDKKGVKGDEEERPPAIHIRTQNRVESEPTNKKTSDRPQPLLPVAVVTEDIPKLRPQPPPPENSDVKDQNKRGISANFDDKQGLPTEPPRSSRLPPLTLKQPTVEEEDASKEKPKKKRKNKKKKGQMNEETQAEEMEELQNKTTEDQFDGD